MHRRIIAPFKRTFEAHAIFHHTNQYGEVFVDEPVPVGEDKEIQMTVAKAPIKGLPFALPIALFPGLELQFSYR